MPWKPTFRFESRQGWFRCPCHGSTYTKAGVRVFGPAPRALDTMEVTVNEDGSLSVDSGHITKGNQGNPMLMIDYLGGRKPRVDLRRWSSFAANEKGKINLHVYSARKDPPKFALAICTGENYRWQESKPVSLKKGWNAISFSLNSNEWMSEKSKWKFEAAPKELNDVRALNLLIYNGRDGGVLYVDAFHIDRDKTIELAIDKWIGKLYSSDAAERDQAEKELTKLGHPVVERMLEFAEKNTEAANRARRIAEKFQATMLTERKVRKPSKSEKHWKKKK